MIDIAEFGDPTLIDDRSKGKSITYMKLHEDSLLFLKQQQRKSIFLELYQFMFTAREIDSLEEQYTKSGESFFHVSGAGHEAVGTLNPHLIKEDYLHCHYRDKALMLARGISPEMFFHSLFCKDASHSRGRQMSAHMSARMANILSLVGPVGNNALQAVGIAAEIKSQSKRPIVVCALGDGTSQQGEVLESIAEAVRWKLPVLFLIENNRFAISTLTDKKTFYNLPHGNVQNFYGLPIHRLEGRDPIVCFQAFENLVSGIRETRNPALALMSVERLTSHTSADDQSIYRDPQEIQKVVEEYDPIKILRLYLEASGVSSTEFEHINEKIRLDIHEAAKKAQFSNDPKPVFDAKAPLPQRLSKTAKEYRGSSDSKRLTMLEAMRKVLHDRMQEDSRITLYGEDIEDPKGDVFGVTLGLSSDFPGRVVNSPLSESTIVGTSIGRALAGGRPVGFLQFADFLPLAFNQVASELGSMYWRTDGAWQCPVILMITCGGYRPGLGPFHAQSLEAIAVHTPGIDVAMPSTAGDAAGMLNAAFDSGRPTLFFYPKSCLNLVDLASTTSSDTKQHYVPIGKARVIRDGQDITFVAYGNAVQRCLKAAKSLEIVGIEAEVIDLRWLSPWDQETILKSACKTGKLIVVHEDNYSCGMGSEILAVIAEKSGIPVQVRRVTRADTLIPCNFANQLEVLPSYKRILEAAAELLMLDLDWMTSKQLEEGTFIVEAIGVGPSDETIIVIDVTVNKGEEVEEGQILAVLEASKAVFDLEAPVKGVVEEIYVTEDQEVQVGDSLFRIHVEPENFPAPKPITREEPGQPLLKRREKTFSGQLPHDSVQTNNKSLPKLKVGIKGVASALPSKIIPNAEVIKSISGREATEVFELTGIETRHWIEEDESVLTLATQAAQEVLNSYQVDIHDIDLIIFCTGTPLEITPSLACQVLYSLAGNQHECQAYDINAACTGYLYGLQNAYLYLQANPNSQVLLITSETLSKLLDCQSFDTHIIFSDGATATILCGETYIESCLFLLNNPLLKAHGEPLDSLYVPTVNSGKSLAMNGRRVFIEGIRKMTSMLNQACSIQRISVDDLDLVIPHQANQRIIDAIGKKTGLTEKIGSNIRHHGNTSSSSIPIYLSENWADIQDKNTIALTAFGGGFTYGAAILERYLESKNDSHT
ncbi:MAG: beta-ketoacyl-ACP synthase 3 [Xenococcus sp. MO_188.B8]|nr:beta-ketoacyl-ACP synthase 3 [Xenococcus sp. MO_188.B8]